MNYYQNVKILFLAKRVYYHLFYYKAVVFPQSKSTWVIDIDAWSI